MAEDHYDMIAAGRLMCNAATLIATVEGMKAENQDRLSRGESIAYTEVNFQQAIIECQCGHNDVFGIIQRSR